jgi:hypothetical protein
MFGKLSSFAGISYFTALMYSLSKENWYFFLAHPLLMGIGFPLLFLEGILLLKNSSLLIVLFSVNRPKNLHYWTSVIATIFWNIGIWVIYQNKEINKKQHFTSYHSWMGIFVFLLIPIQMIMGRKFYVVGDWVTKFIPDSAIQSIRSGHKEFGKWLVWFASITIVLASYSNWVLKKTQFEQSALFITSWILCISCFLNLFAK